jgi:hypothetical protein
MSLYVNKTKEKDEKFIDFCFDYIENNIKINNITKYNQISKILKYNDESYYLKISYEEDELKLSIDKEKHTFIIPGISNKNEEYDSLNIKLDKEKYLQRFENIIEKTNNKYKDIFYNKFSKIISVQNKFYTRKKKIELLINKNK